MISILLLTAVLFWVVYLFICQVQTTTRPRTKYFDKFEQQSEWNYPTHRLDWLDQDTMLMYNVGVEKCLELCDQDSNCKGFVYVPRESLCKFKSDFTKPVFARGHITYLKF